MERMKDHQTPAPPPRRMTWSQIFALWIACLAGGGILGILLIEVWIL